MDNGAVVEDLERLLLAAEHILDTEYSFDLAEPTYRACLELIAGAPDQRETLSDLLIAMYESKRVSDEPIAYLMHSLRWSEVREWAERSLRSDPTAFATGAGRANILAAYFDDWENRDFYVF
ncbi:hypothetical protein [Stenotrophomonas sp.]|uniref:hypothetical protein n=1 Tax=Stenotrophomonas sp. TaxID=69392 RepID=UPI0028A7D4B4|nr:hypothetical protein [Stenotrophomonas sp.]